MSTASGKPRAAKATKATGSVFGAGFASATPPVAPPPAAPQPPPVAPAADPTPPPAQPQQPAPAAPAAQAGPAGGLTAYLGGGHDGDGADFLAAMLAGPPLDPMLDLVQLGAKIPRHYAEALRLLTVAQRRHKQQLVIEALAAYIGPQLLAKALDAQQGRR
ncbi:hypothetical protein AB0N38_10665 [Micromonospora aurantiaca]|uniref:hypothetical protein n=1 Tax=Micromonospora aurantiaca (nom. illeg.) TaxID=47850 RepID=UPI003442DAA1